MSGRGETYDIEVLKEHVITLTSTQRISPERTNAMKSCSICEKEFEPQKDYFHMCPACFWGDKPHALCRAITGKGTRCTRFEEFVGVGVCHQHTYAKNVRLVEVEPDAPILVTELFGWSPVQHAIRERRTDSEGAER